MIPALIFGSSSTFFWRNGLGRRVPFLLEVAFHDSEDSRFKGIELFCRLIFFASLPASSFVCWRTEFSHKTFQNTSFYYLGISKTQFFCIKINRLMVGFIPNSQWWLLICKTQLSNSRRPVLFPVLAEIKQMSAFLVHHFAKEENTLTKKAGWTELSIATLLFFSLWNVPQRWVWTHQWNNFCLFGGKQRSISVHPRADSRSKDSFIVSGVDFLAQQCFVGMSTKYFSAKFGFNFWTCSIDFGLSDEMWVCCNNVRTFTTDRKRPYGCISIELGCPRRFSKHQEGNETHLKWERFGFESSKSAQYTWSTTEFFLKFEPLQCAVYR